MKLFTRKITLKMSGGHRVVFHAHELDVQHQGGTIVSIAWSGAHAGPLFVQPAAIVAIRLHRALNWRRGFRA